MKVNKLVFPLLGALAVAFHAHADPAKDPVAATPEESFGITLEANYDSRLIYHGIDFGEHFASGEVLVDLPMNDTVQASLEASFGNVFDPVAVGGDYQRMLLGAGLSTYLGAAELGLVYRWIHHEGVPTSFVDDGHEVGLTLASSVGPVNVGAGGYHDFGDDGWYFELAVNTEFQLNEKVKLVPSVAIGYGLDYAANRTTLNVALGDGFFALTPSIALPIKLTERTTLTPYIAGRIALDAIEAAGEKDRLYGGVSISVSF